MKVLIRWHLTLFTGPLLIRALSPRPSSRCLQSSWAVGQERAQVPALGLDRGRQLCRRSSLPPPPRKRLGRHRGKKIARVETAGKLAEAIFHMLS